MPSHLEIWKPSGRELITLSGERVTVGKASTNIVSLKHDSTVSRLHAVLENLGFAWSVRDVGSGNGTYLSTRKDLRRTGPAFWRRVAGRQVTVDLLGGKAS